MRDEIYSGQVLGRPWTIHRAENSIPRTDSRPPVPPFLPAFDLIEFLNAGEGGQPNLSSTPQAI